MICFPCKCGYRFELPDELSGGLEQCPVCHRLVDVPTLSDLSNLSDDGTFLLEEPPELTDGLSLGDLHEAFTASTVDATTGEEIDLRRPGIDPLRWVRSSKNPARVAPRYDPVSGELIRPIELNDEPPMAAVPIDEPDSTFTGSTIATSANLRRPARSLRYASQTNQRRITAGSSLIELLMPANIIVLVIISLVYYAATMMSLWLWVGNTVEHFYLQVLNIPLLLILAHYGCVIEDMGPDAAHELPRPLRFAELVDDIFNPMFHVLLAMVLCFGPAVVLLSHYIPLPGQSRAMLVMLFGVIGVLLFPAVLLTAVTGSTLVNLRPDRVLGVILTAGADYILSLGALAVSIILSAVVFAHPNIQHASPWYASWHRLQEPYVILPITLSAVYTTHYFCWLLGLMYRNHQPNFPWIFQQHVRMPRPPVSMGRAD